MYTESDIEPDVLNAKKNKRKKIIAAIIIIPIILVFYRIHSLEEERNYQTRDNVVTLNIPDGEDLGLSRHDNGARPSSLKVANGIYDKDFGGLSITFTNAPKEEILNARESMDSSYERIACIVNYSYPSMSVDVAEDLIKNGIDHNEKITTDESYSQVLRGVISCSEAAAVVRGTGEQLSQTTEQIIDDVKVAVQKATNIGKGIYDVVKEEYQDRR